MNFRYFTIGELTESATARRYAIKNIPGTIELNNLISLVENLLDPLRSLLGRPVNVSSGYRCKALNSKVGGSKTSAHVKGLAADIHTKGNNLELAYLAKDLPFDQCIIYDKLENPTWIHISYASNPRHQYLFCPDRKRYIPLSEERVIAAWEKSRKLIDI